MDPDDVVLSLYPTDLHGEELVYIPVSLPKLVYEFIYIIFCAICLVMKQRNQVLLLEQLELDNSIILDPNRDAVDSEQKILNLRLLLDILGNEVWPSDP